MRWSSSPLDFVRLWGQLLRHSNFLEKGGRPNFWLNVLIYITILCQFKCYRYLKWRWTLQKFPGIVASPRPCNCTWNKPKLVAKQTFSQLLINADFALLPGYAVRFWWMWLKIALHTLFRQPRFWLVFILSKNNCFQPGASLKMHPFSPSFKKYGQDIQK